jgi:hypothetical protein
VASGPRPNAKHAAVGARLSADRLAFAERAAGGLRERRAAMDEETAGKLERREVDEPPASAIAVATEASAPAFQAALAEPPRSTARTDPAPPDGAARSLASVMTAERLAVELQRRERAAGPELHLSLGGTLEVRLVQEHRGVALAIASSRSIARMARAELPALVRALAEGGVRVVRAEVRPAGEGESGARPRTLAR